MMPAIDRTTIKRLWRYYQAGLVNTAFGYGIYALFVALGLNMYVAQIIGHVLGVGFNYFTYSRHVFSDSSASKSKFVLSYVFSYFLSLGSLAAAASVIESPYVAGAVSVLFVSVLNYFVLRRLVFRPKAAA